MHAVGRRRIATLVLVWQLITPFALAGVVSACMPDAPKAATCCTMAKDGQACPMHAKTSSGASCHLRCAGVDANPLALIEMTGPLPASTRLNVSLESVPACVQPDPSVSPRAIAFDPPPPRA